MKTRLISPPDPGLYRDVPADQYHSWDAVNKSLLSVLKRGTPEHVKHWLTYGDDYTSKALTIGDAFDDMVLGEEDQFRNKWQIAEPCQAVIASGARSGENCGADAKPYDGVWYCGKHARKAGEPDTENVLSDADLAMLANMTQSIERHPIANALINGEGGVNQLSVVWDEDTASGPLRCKCRYDRWCEFEGNSCFVDLKSARSADPYRWEKDAEQFHYPLQAAHYCAGLRAIEHMRGVKQKHRRFYFVVIEKDLDGLAADQHRVEVFEYDQDDLARVEEERQEMLEEYADCRLHDIWPGRVPMIRQLTISPYYFRKAINND